MHAAQSKTGSLQTGRGSQTGFTSCRGPPCLQHSWTSDACSSTSQLMREGAEVGRGERTMLGGDSELSWHL